MRSSRYFRLIAALQVVAYGLASTFIDEASAANPSVQKRVRKALTRVSFDSSDRKRRAALSELTSMRVIRPDEAVIVSALPDKFYVRRIHNGHITRLGIRSDQLNESHLRSLVGLRLLDFITVNRTKQPGQRRVALHALRSLPALKTLRLGLDVTDEELEQIGELRGLKALWVHKSPNTPRTVSNHGLAHLNNLRELTELDIAFCQGFDDHGLTQLKTLTRIEKLSISYSSITGIGLRALGNCRKLKALTTVHSPIDDAGLSAISCLHGLESLNVQHCTQITDNGIESLVRLEQLKTLSLREVGITNSALPHVAKMGNLRSLSLYGNRITDAGLMNLTKLKQLTHLDLGQTDVTSDGLQNFAKAHGSLRSLGGSILNR